MFFICWRHVSYKVFVPYFMVLICSLLQLINKFILVVFMQVFGTRDLFSDIGTMLKFGTLNCIKLFYNSISGQFNQFLYYVTFSGGRSSFSWLVLFHTRPKILPKESGYIDFKKVVDFVFNFPFSLLLYISNFSVSWGVLSLVYIVLLTVILSSSVFYPLRFWPVLF